ncbi:MAG TPA: hypothetical protein VFU22_00165 [Roseiflexaceae bacterium]|nr:hypothetical protein [Roseiflexaceae bacterium]
MSIWPQDWNRVLLPQAPIVESIARISIVYLSAGGLEGHPEGTRPSKIPSYWPLSVTFVADSGQ